VGNVLNSVNVSATLVADRLRNSKITELNRALGLLDEHAAELGRFLTEDRRGKQLPGFLRLVAGSLDRERTVMTEELQSLTRNIEHIKTIVAMQQSYTGMSGVIETVALPQLLDDAIKLNSASLAKYHIEVVREYEDLPEIHVDKQRVLQILVNLVTNAKDALIESAPAQPCLTVRIALRSAGDDEKLVVEICDNGMGIPAENLVRIFSHGFTTKKHGHGFGLHSSANAAKELGGALTARSDGRNRGATFTLELPFEPVEVLV
jgi:signal transduction histidine kinase